MKMKVKDVITNELTDKQISDLWFDWFCSDKALVNRGKQLIRRLRKIAKNTNRFNIETADVWFKNNCPVDGKLYDSITIKDEQNQIFYWVVPRSGHTIHNGRAELWSSRSRDKPIIAGDWKNIVNYFKAK